MTVSLEGDAFAGRWRKRASQVQFSEIAMGIGIAKLRSPVEKRIGDAMNLVLIQSRLTKEIGYDTRGAAGDHAVEGF